MKTSTQKLVLSSIFASIICVVTMVLKIPAPKGGYFNLGDAAVLLAGYSLPPVFGFFAAGLGSSLADVFSGFAVYAPVTFIIKGVMAFIVQKASCKKTDSIFLKTAPLALAETIMVMGYYLFEGFLYGFLPSLANIPLNLSQGALCLVIGLFLIRALEKNGKLFR